jgi:hypothetical protein
MLNIIANSMMTATRTDARDYGFMNRDENALHLFREANRRREEKRQLDQALARGLLK